MLVPTHAKVYLYNEITDMRKSINTLSILIADVLDLDPCFGHLFLFRNRHGDKLKALYDYRTLFPYNIELPKSTE